MSVREIDVSRLAFLRRNQRIAYYSRILEGLKSEEPVVESATEPPVKQNAASADPQSYRVRVAGRKNDSGDIQLAMKNNLTAAVVRVSEGTIRVRETLLDEDVDPDLLKLHTGALYRELHSLVKSQTEARGVKLVEIVTSNPVAMKFLSPLVEGSPDGSYSIPAESFTVPGIAGRPFDARGKEPLTCHTCGVEKTRDDFKNKTYNLKLKESHPAYGKKMQCRECDNKEKRERRRKKLDEGAQRCKTCKGLISSVADHDLEWNSDKTRHLQRHAFNPMTQRQAARWEKQLKDNEAFIKAHPDGTPNVLPKEWTRKKKDEGVKNEPFQKIELPTSPEDMIEPFDGLAVRAGEDDPTIMRFEPKRKFVQKKPPVSEEAQPKKAKKRGKK